VRAHKYPSSSRTFQLVPEVLVCQLPVVHPSTSLFNVKNKKKNSTTTLMPTAVQCPYSLCTQIYAEYTYCTTYVFWVVPKVTYFTASGRIWHFFRFYYTTRSASMDEHMCVCVCVMCIYVL